MTPPPHNLEAEQALLGALLFDNSLLQKLPELDAEHFYDPVHGRIFSEIKRLVDSGTIADAVRLRTWARADQGVCSLGPNGTYLLTLLERAAPLSVQALDYGAAIADAASRRAVMRICGQAVEAIQDARQDPREVVHAAERALTGLMLGRQGWISAREAGRAVADSLGLDGPRGIRTGLSKLDRLLAGGLYAPDLVIIAGRPAMGKTALADVIATNAADAGAVVAFFSMEMSPEQIAARMLARRSAATTSPFGYSSLRGRDQERPTRERVAPFVERLPENLLIDPTGAQTLAGIEAAARAMRSRAGALDVLVVDYLQLMRDASARKDGRTQEVSEITAGLKAIGKKLDVSVVALSQLSRAVENRADKMPQLSDLRESGSIEQDADAVVFVYREHYYLERQSLEPRSDEAKEDFSRRLNAHQQRLKDTAHELKLICAKNRHGPCGIEDLWCDLSMDVVLDEPMSRRSLEAAP